MEHRRRLPDVLGCGDDVDYHTVASTPYTAALARSSCVWAPALSATHRGAKPARCRRSSPGGVLPGAAASARLRRPSRPDRQPSPGCVDRGVLAGACGSNPDPAGAACVRVRSHSSAGLRPSRGKLWPQRRQRRLLHTASGRGNRHCGPWLASLNPPATAASHVPRTSSSRRPSQRHLLSQGTVPNRRANVQGAPEGGGPKRPGVGDQAGLAALAGCPGCPKTGGGESCPPVRRPKRERPRAQMPMNRGRNALRRRAAPLSFPTPTWHGSASLWLRIIIHEPLRA